MKSIPVEFGDFVEMLAKISKVDFIKWFIVFY